MSRFSLVLAFAIVLSFVGITPVQAQGSATLAPEDAILRLEESENWIFVRDAAGTPWVIDNHQVQDGVPLVELNPSTTALYEQHQVRDVFATTAEFLPVSYSYESISTYIQTRVIYLPDAQHAEAYLNSILDAQLEAVALGEIEDRQFAPIDPLPQTYLPLVGWSSVSAIVDLESGAPKGYASGARYHAQVDNIVVSVEVVGPFVDFNFDLAFWLVQNQALCVQWDTPCTSMPIPTGNSEWNFVGDVLFFNDPESGESIEARWLHPVEGPVLKPEYSATISPP